MTSGSLSGALFCQTSACALSAIWKLAICAARLGLGQSVWKNGTVEAGRFSKTSDSLRIAIWKRAICAAKLGFGQSV